MRLIVPLIAVYLCVCADPLVAQETYDAPILIQPNEPVLAPIEELVLAPTYSPENPFAFSEYTDLADVAEVIIANGGNIDSYFYSEGFTTGTDGELGNEHVCIRDDANRVYIGRSDVCSNRKEAGYDYIHIDQIDLDNFSLSPQQTQSPLFDPDQIYQTEDLIGNTSQYWDGCYSINQGWGGQSGGSCPTINDQNGGQINYGYVSRTLTNTAAIDQALKGVGLETTGYTYSWRVKNADANWTTTGNGRAQADPFEVTVKIYDENGNSVFEKSYDYSYWMDWTEFTGSEEFNEPFNLDEISELQLSVTGYDIGYWAGYYGPEFQNPNIKLNYRVAQDTGPSPEEMVMEQMCRQDPLYDISCPGYNDAFITQLSQQSLNSANQLQEDFNPPNVPEANTNNLPNNLRLPNPVDNSQGRSKTNTNGTEDPIDQTTGISRPDRPAADPVEESEPAAAEEKKSTGLTANQLLALDIASEATSAAQSTAVGQASQSANIGLSTSGGVSSNIISDGVSSTDGSIGSNFSSSNNQSQNSSQSGGGSSSNNNTSDTSSISADINNRLLEFNLPQQSAEASGNSFEMTSLDIDTLDINTSVVDSIINSVVANLILNTTEQAEDIAEESSEESIEEMNAKEDELVAAARAGSNDEDAQAALLGYNPNFRQYQQPQLPDSQFYAPKEIYEGQKNYDNPSQRFFNGASDMIHREMVRQQYD